MRVYQQTRRLPVRSIIPSEAARLSGGGMKRCGTCGFRWSDNDPAGGVTEEDDGIERCQQCLEVRTAVYIADQESAIAAQIGSRPETPQISQATLEEPLLSALNSIEDSNGRVLSCGSPLLLFRNIPASVLLRGVRLAATDAISYTSGITDSVAPVITATMITLTVVASLSAIPGDHYHITFNDVTYRDVFQVR